MRLVFSLILLSLNFILVGQASVYVESGEFGRGILKSRAGECFVITPFHVVEDGGMISSVYGEKSVRSDAEMVKSFSGDLAVLRITGGGRQKCTEWNLHPDFSGVMERIYEGFLEIRYQDGSVKPMPVSIKNISEQFITVQPRNFRDKFTKGISGSSLFTTLEGEKIYLGMIQSIDDEDPSMGYVYRADNMERVLGSFFSSDDEPGNSADAPLRTMLAGDDVILSDKVFSSNMLGFNFKLDEFKKNGTTVTVRFKVTSINRDQQFKMSANQIGVRDPNGRVTNANAIRIANWSGYHANYKMIQGVPTNVEMVFYDVSSSVKSFSEFTMMVSDEQRRSETLKMTDIALNRAKGKLSGSRKDYYWSDELLGFELKLTDYEKKGTTVKLNFIITTKSNDMNIRFSSNDFVLYDNEGSAYQAKSTTIANKTSYHVEHRIITGVKTKMTVTYEGVASGATGITLFQGFLRSPSSSQIFQIRNLSFSKKGGRVEVERLEGIWSDELLGVDVQLLNVTESGGTGLLQFSITSLSEDVSFRASANNFFVYNQDGVEVQANQLSLANTKNYHLDYRLLKGVPVRFDIRIDKFPENSTSIALFKGVVTVSKTNREFEIRNLSLRNVNAITSVTKGKTSVSEPGENEAPKSACSDIYLYRTNALLQSASPVMIYLGKQEIARLSPGVRLHIITCDQEKYTFAAKFDPNALTFAKSTVDTSKGGGTFFLKVSSLANLDMAAIKQINPNKGLKDLSNDKKFASGLQVLNW